MKTKSFCLAMLMAGMSSGLSAQVVINVDAKKQGPVVSPTHYGIFYEDINHAADGGLYAELIRNRSFEDDMMPLGGRGRRGRNRQVDTTPRITSWSAEGQAQIGLTQQNLLNGVQHNALNVVVSGKGGGVRNEGFWGINAVKGREYQLSFFIRSDKGYKGKMTAQLVGADGTVLASAPVKVNAKANWQKMTAQLTATADDAKAQFVLTADKACQFQLDVVSLFPPTFKNRPNGMRPDLAQMLADMHPKFMRFPGGCFVEGQQSPDNAFRWKRTIGPIEEREGHANVNWGYRTSDGIGFHEYLQLSEDLGAKPLFVVNVGIWHGGCDPYDKIDSWIEECLDALEYANGPVTSKYGKMRADNGHPAPFNLEYIEIGNENYNYNMENNSDQSDHYPERYIQFYNAIKAKYPNVKCIGNVESWSTDNPSWRNSYPVDMVDEHYYRNPKWFADRFNKYDSYPRNSHKVYVGEYAVTSQFGDIGNLNAALGEAVYMMGMENNTDVVVMNSYAPIFVNENDARWRPDMIRFNSRDCMGTPSYYVQQLFPNNIGTRVLKTDYTWKLQKPEPVKAEEEKPVQVGLAAWNTTVEYRNPTLTIDGKEIKLNEYSKWTSQSGEWKAENGSYVQTSNQQPAISLCPELISAKKYSYKVEAMKRDGAEGFMIMVNYQDKQHFQWYNIGGWGNVQSNVEQTIGGGRIQIGRDKRFHVENNRWYTVQVDVDGDSLYCYIDGKQDFACKLQKSSAMEGVYATTTIDEANNLMYVKVVNVGEGKAEGVLNLANCEVNTSKADAVSLIRLSSASGDDENTLQNPRAIYPVQAEAKSADSHTVKFQVPAFSVNILKIQIQVDVNMHTETDNGVSLTWIKDMPGDTKQGKRTFSDTPDEVIAELHLEDGIPSSMSCLLMDIDGEKVLFDAGLGGKNSLLHQSLSELGTSEEQIKTIFITHLHGDHIGGLMDGEKKVFPNAEIYLNKVEYDAWMAMPDDRNGQQRKIFSLYADKLHLFTVDESLPFGIQPMAAYGHTPGHTIFQKGKFLIIGDLMHGAALQMVHPEYCPSFDMDKKTAVESRKKFLKYAADNKLMMAGMHLPSPGFIK